MAEGSLIVVTEVAVIELSPKGTKFQYILRKLPKLNVKSKALSVKSFISRHFCRMINSMFKITERQQLNT